MAAFMGCPVEFVSETSWSQPILHDWSRMDEIRFDQDSKWFRKCLEFLDFLVEQGSDRFAVGPPDISPGSPGDLAAAIRGRERFIVDLYRHPEEVKELMGICARAYIEIVDMLCERITHPFGGTVIGWLFNWIPGRRSGIVQEDLTTLLSPELYRSFIKPFDE